MIPVSHQIEESSRKTFVGLSAFMITCSFVLLPSSPREGAPLFAIASSVALSPWRHLLVLDKAAAHRRIFAKRLVSGWLCVLFIAVWMLAVLAVHLVMIFSWSDALLGCFSVVVVIASFMFGEVLGRRVAAHKFAGVPKYLTVDVPPLAR